MQLMLEYGELGTRTAAEPTATTTSAASGGSSEELLGPRPAIRKQGAADAGCRNPALSSDSETERLVHFLIFRTSHDLEIGRAHV